MPRRQRWWTTVTDLEEYSKLTWSFLKNIKMTWEYDGMAYLFRNAGIPICGIDRGTMKMNHPIMTLGVPMQHDKNYGVDIYVPVNMKGKAIRLLQDEDRVRECAELEEAEGDAHAELFNQEALGNKRRHSEERKERRRSLLRRLVGSAQSTV